MKLDESYITIPRSILQSDVWNKKEKYSKIEAFLYLAREARFQTSVAYVDNIEVGRGQLVASYSELMSLWKLSNRNEVKRYIDFFVSQGWIKVQKLEYNSLITVIHLQKCNRNVTANVTPIVTEDVTPKPAQTEMFPETNVTPFVTGDVTGDVTEMIQSRVRVSFESLDNNSSNNNINNKEKEEELIVKFDEFRKKYRTFGGKVRGLDTELKTLKKHKDWREVIPKLDYAIEKENNARKTAKCSGNFFAEMKNLQTYINQRAWEYYSEGYENDNPEEYHPLTDDIFQTWNEERKCLRFNGDLAHLNDGYTDDNRPDGAMVSWGMYSWKWNKAKKQWIES